jgi:aminopeptidase YwaD
VLRRAASSTLLLLLACAGWDGPLEAGPAVDRALWRSEAAWLADPVREGRGLGTEGLAAAGERLAEQFAAAGLEPGAPGGGFFHAFRMPIAVEVAEARLALGGEALAHDKDFRPLWTSADGAFSGPLVFAGYGVRDEATGWDDWAGVDVKDAVVLVLDGRPDQPEFADRRGAALGRRGAKLLAAREHGARGVLFAPAPGPTDEPLGPELGGALPTRSSAGVVALALSRAAAERALARAGLDLAALAASAEQRQRPAPSAIRAEGAVRIVRREGEVANVIGRLPGADPSLEGEQVVVGAHYDHLGRGEFGSMRPGRVGEVHPGADDNASGAAALVALARAFAAGPRPARTLVFAAFTAEEAGLVGSARYVEALDPGTVVAMVNLDMIGRLGEGTVTVFGGETAAGFPELVRWSATQRSVAVAFEDGAHGPSDHASFLAASIPALFFTTGAHEAYHSPDDVAEALDAAGAERVLGLAADVVQALANAPRAPVFAGAAEPKRAPSGDGGYGPYLGTVPAFGSEGFAGAKLAAIRAGSPAERAGLRPGDVIVEFAGSRVTSLEDFAVLLMAQREGARIPIVVRRGAERVETEAVLGRRP